MTLLETAAARGPEVPAPARPRYLAELAEGVRVTPAGLVDALRPEPVALNASGRAALDHVLRTDTTAAAEAVSARYAVRPAVAERDVHALCRTLNSAGLLNLRLAGTLRQRAGTRSRRVLGHLATGRLPALPFGVRRRPVDTGSVRALLRTGTRALLPAALWYAVGTTVFALLLLLGLGAAASWSVVAIVAGAAGGVLVHELGHVLGLRSVPTAVLLDGPRPAVVHAPVSAARLALVTAAGPLAGLVTGLAALAVASAVHSGAVALFSVLLVSQGLGLTVIASDGRRLCRLL